MDNTNTLRLAPSLALRENGAFVSALKAALAGPAALVIDTSDLKSADLSLLQLLVAAHRSARTLGLALTILVPAGGAMEELMARYGLSPQGGGPAQIADGRWTGLTIH